MKLKNLIGSRMNTACVVGALAPYTRRVQETLRDKHGLSGDFARTLQPSRITRVLHGFICENPCSSVAN